MKIALELLVADQSSSSLLQAMITLVESTGERLEIRVPGPQATCACCQWQDCQSLMHKNHLDERMGVIMC